MAQTEDHIPFLDHLRGFAIASVFAYHSLGASFGKDGLKWDGWFRNFHEAHSFLVLLPVVLGWGGVAIFFVVSGFCIHLSHERARRKDLNIFFSRRFFRIYPPYFVALIFFAFLFPFSRLGWNSFHSFAQLGSHVFLIHNFNGRSIFGINAAFWSIAVEVQLYLLYPLLLLGVRRWGWRNALWFTGVLEITLRTVAGIFCLRQEEPLHGWFFGSPFFYWFSWSIGAKLADDWLYGRPFFLRKCPVWIWVVLVIVSYLIRPLAPFCFLFVALSTANLITYLLVHPGTRLGLPGFVRSHLRSVGVLSYSVYLLHEPLILIVPWAMGKAFPGGYLNPAVTFVICLASWPLVLLLSWLFYRVVELPSISAGKWFVRSKLSALPGNK